jgi:7,8-dihydroneopterin aldolase/epimerase/oxygenase
MSVPRPGPVSEVIIEVQGLELRGYHGALEEEQRSGQRFLFDVTLVAHDAGVRSDQLADTVDYTAVVARVREVSDRHRFNLIEALAAAVADDLLHHFPASHVRVRVRKPEVQLEAPAEYTAATVERSRL